MAKKEHVEEGEGGHHCRHCLGEVDEDGFRPLGEREEFSPVEHSDTDQQHATIKMREEAGGDFASAVKMARGGRVGNDRLIQRDDSYAEGGTVEEAADAVESPAEAAKKALEEMRKRKQERYGGRR